MEAKITDHLSKLSELPARDPKLEALVDEPHGPGSRERSTAKIHDEVVSRGDAVLDVGVPGELDNLSE